MDHMQTDSRTDEQLNKARSTQLVKLIKNMSFRSDNTAINLATLYPSIPIQGCLLSSVDVKLRVVQSCCGGIITVSLYAAQF